MARPIKETPILFGEDARRFEERMKQVRRETPEERERRNANYELFKKMLERGEQTFQTRRNSTVSASIVL